MNAKEMFEKLGYEYKDHMGYINYINYKKDEIVKFDLEERTYFLSNLNISIELHQTIHQQLRELGWVE